MIKNLLEYITTDVFTQLALLTEISHRGSDSTHWHRPFNENKKDRIHTHTKRSNVNYDDSELHQITMDKLPVDDTPIKLVTEYSYRMENGNFHSMGKSHPSIYIEIMELIFPEVLPNYGRRKGPNIIRLTDVKKYHENGKLVSLTCENAKYTWTIDGVSRRESGPYMMEYRNVDFRVPSKDDENPTWGTIEKIFTDWKKAQSTRTIIMQDAQDALLSNYVDYDLYSATDFFRDPLDEMSFLNSVT